MERAFAAGDDVPLGVSVEGRAAALAWAPPGFRAFDVCRVDDGEDASARTETPAADDAEARTPDDAEARTPDDTATEPANGTDADASAEAPPPADADPAEKPRPASVADSIESPAASERRSQALAREPAIDAMNAVPTLEEACESAIREADESERWKTIDHVGDPIVWAICEGADEHPWNGPVSALPVPDRFAEHGPPPVVTLTGPGPPCGIEVSGGTVRLRFVEHHATVTVEISDPPPPPGNTPLVVVRSRADSAPEVLIRGGKAKVRIEGWHGPDEAGKTG